MSLGPFLGSDVGIGNKMPEPRVRELVADDGGVELAVKEHLDEFLAVRRALDARGVPIFGNVRIFKCDPFYLVYVDPVVVRQNAPHPRAGRHRIGANADTFTSKI